MKILLATKNRAKVQEIKAILNNNFSFIDLLQFNGIGEPEEEADSLEANALAKAIQSFNATSILSLADDSGLFVDALKGRPGVFSARYGTDDRERIERLLRELQGCEERSATFKCVIAVVYREIREVFSGECRGRIAHQPSGKAGFGYDPIFIPEGYDRTFAELGAVVKHQISHRAKALLQAKAYLLNLARQEER
ncbi:MAG: RdgB/HAM1 family non-canonical purine NTP pyrophosphatase [candidate division WOR-3 bacterium]